MSVDAEKIAAEILRLVTGYGETVVMVTDGGPVRLDRWLCKRWSLPVDRRVSDQDVIIGLWLRYVSESDVDRKTVEYVVNTYTYKIMKDESEKLGLDRGPDMKRLDLYFFPAELWVEKIYNRRVVYSLEPCKDEAKVSVVKVFQPVWSVCEYGEPRDCQRRKTLTENIKARGVPIDDVVDGVYVPLDTSDLVDLLQRVL